MDRLTAFSEILLWTLPLAMVAANIVALLILRSVFRRDDLATLVYAAVMIAAFPYPMLFAQAAFRSISLQGQFDQLYLFVALVLASTILLLVLWLAKFVQRQGRQSYKAGAATVFAVAISFISWAQQESATFSFEDSLPEAIPTIMFASFLVAIWAMWSLFRIEDLAKILFCSVLVAQLACTLPIVAAILCALGSYPAERLSAKAAFLGLATMPGGLLIVLWLFSFVWHSRPDRKSYAVEAATALIIGISDLAWLYEVMVVWNAVD